MLQTQNHSQIKTEDSMTNIQHKAYLIVDEYFKTKKEQTKGLFLYGPNGTGKTTSMSKHTHHEDGSPKMWAGSSIDINMIVQQKGRGYLQKYNTHDMYIDDLGREDLTVSSYADKDIKVMHDLIFIRYQAFKQGCKTHFSSNLGFSELQERYGIPIVDRIKEMCDIVEFKGESLRK